MNKSLIFIVIFLSHVAWSFSTPKNKNSNDDLKICIVGLSHGHARLVFKYLNTNKIKIVGIAESNPELIERFSKQFNLDKTLFYSNIDNMLDQLKPQAVAVFTSTYDHLQVIEKCAMRGIHVMVEKPLAVNEQHAKKIQELSLKYNIKIVTNFETTWHPAIKQMQYDVFLDKKIGEVKKIVFHDGNYGINSSGDTTEFFKWATNPKLNGGGALMDFGCYGINIVTWLLKGEIPISVTAQLNNFQRKRFPNVDDDATIILNYDNLQVIILASWNWAIPRKDIELYGDKGYFIVDDANHYRTRTSKTNPELKFEIGKSNYPVNKPFEYFSNIVNGTITPQAFEPVTIENNIIVSQILDAAKKSAKRGKTIYLKH